MPIPLDKIIEAAEKAGFATELRAASILTRSKWTVRQNVYYIDKDEGKGRELDLRSFRIFSSTSEKPEVTCMVTLCIEVKKTADPFIFYTSEKDKWELGGGYGLCHWKSNVTRHVLSYNDIELRRPSSKTPRLARSYSNFKNGQTQQIQSGLISAFKAAIHECDHCKEFYSDTSGDICFFVPVMVVDGPLYECFLNKGDGILAAQEVDEVIYRQNYHSENYGRQSHDVYVMNMATLEKRLPEFIAWGEHMLAVMKRNRSKVLTSPESS